MLIPFLSLVLLGPRDAAIRREIAADYAAFGKAFGTADVRGMDRLLADDYVQIQGGRIQRKRQVLAGYRQMALAMRNPSWSRKVLGLRIGPGTVDVAASGEMGGLSNGKQIRFEVLCTDTWARTKHGYLLRKSFLHRYTLKADGKPIRIH